MDSFPGIEYFSNVKIGSTAAHDSAFVKESVVTTRSGHISAKVQRPDGREVFLHSR